MKTITTIVLFICLILIASCEKDGGKQTNIPDLSIDSLKILPADIPGGLYTDLTFVDKNTGFAITNSGLIVKTTDGGYNWEQLTSHVDFFLKRIQFKDTNTGYIIGGDITGGYLLKTIDGGLSWQLINLHTPDKVMPTGLFFLNNNRGFISGEKFFIRTADGGETWSEVMGTISENINDVSFRNSNEGYATSDNGKYYKTADGGKTWQSLQSETDDHLKRIYFTDPGSFAKCRANEFIYLSGGKKAFTVPESAFNFLFLNDRNCIGIGQHYETGFLPYGDVFLTNDAWITFNQRKYNPQSEALNVTAIAKAGDGRIIIIGSGTLNTSVIELRY